jgi:hypothetical protein
MGTWGNVLSRIKYPNLLLLILSYIYMIAFAMFAGMSYATLHDTPVFLGYFGTFLAGSFMLTHSLPPQLQQYY